MQRRGKHVDGDYAENVLVRTNVPVQLARHAEGDSAEMPRFSKPGVDEPCPGRY
jgi:hypothetical protein